MSVQSVLFVHLACLYRPPPHALGEFMRDGSPCTHLQALRPAPREFMRGWRPQRPPICGRSAPRPGLLSRVEKVGKDTPGTSWSLDPRRRGRSPL